MAITSNEPPTSLAKRIAERVVLRAFFSISSATTRMSAMSDHLRFVAEPLHQILHVRDERRGALARGRQLELRILGPRRRADADRRERGLVDRLLLRRHDPLERRVARAFVVGVIARRDAVADRRGRDDAEVDG